MGDGTRSTTRATFSKERSGIPSLISTLKMQLSSGRYCCIRQRQLYPPRRQQTDLQYGRLRQCYLLDRPLGGSKAGHGCLSILAHVAEAPSQACHHLVYFLPAKKIIVWKSQGSNRCVQDCRLRPDIYEGGWGAHYCSVSERWTLPPIAAKTATFLRSADRSTVSHFWSSASALFTKFKG